MTDTNAAELVAVEKTIARALSKAPSGPDHISIRYRSERSDGLSVRRNVLEPVTSGVEAGVMVTVWEQGGSGYAATCELTDAGVADAISRARHWAKLTAGASVLADPPFADVSGTFQSPMAEPWSEVNLADRVALLVDASQRMGTDERIVDWAASISLVTVDSLTLTSGGARIYQHTASTHPSMQVTANEGTNTQTRTYGRGARVGQGGVEILGRYGFADAPEVLAEQALELLVAPNTPTGTMDLVVAPDQMILQIHESIGHPIELDRILGDERNYAGTSFVTTDMFGSYRYGSDLLNVTFDPTVEGQLASYAFDDEGSVADRQYLIRNGILERPLGGAVSQARAGMDGVANARSSSWNRPPIDRMANLNVEPGDSSFEDLIGSVENGVYMETNNSWSIDDSRNKFQFGCEYGRLITDGELGPVVRNPGYRGISATFWRNLSGVGNSDTAEVLGVLTCGKGEPNQVIRVGHASPACRFTDIEVFGGDQ